MTALLAAGAAIEARTQDGDTALHQAVFAGHAACAALVLDGHAHAVVPCVLPHSGSSPAHNLSEAFVNARKRDGSTALHLAALKGDFPTTELLLRHGADRLLRTRGGVTPADLARRHNHGAVLDQLLA